MIAVLKRGQQYIKPHLSSPSLQERPSSLYSTQWFTDTSHLGRGLFLGLHAIPHRSSYGLGVAKQSQCCQQNAHRITAFSSLLPIPLQALFLSCFKYQVFKPGPPAHAQQDFQFSYFPNPYCSTHSPCPSVPASQLLLQLLHRRSTDC